MNEALSRRQSQDSCLAFLDCKRLLMVMKSFLRASRTMQTASLALAIACGAAVILPSSVLAGSGEPASALFKAKKQVTDSSGAVKNNWSHSAGGGGKATTASRIVNDGSVAPFLAADSASSMQALADRYAAIVSSGGWPKVPSGKLAKGNTNKAVEALNKRLYAEGYLRAEATTGEFAQVYTTATEDAVRRFQANHGLAVTGSVDGPTLSKLNVPAERRLATIRANIPRVTEYSKDLGERYVVVNVPAMQIETVQNGTVYSIHNAIVGRPSRPTPVVMTPLSTIRFNPYWNAPASIVERDIVPRMLSSSPSKVMSEMNMKIFKGVGGPEIDPNSVNWRRVVVDDYHFRQEPGGENAMATAKIEFNSPFGIYLHDTPEPHLFETGSRFYSSGCVRVQNVATLINWILQGQDGIDAAKIANLAETKERLDTPVANPPQLRVAYLTAWPSKDGVAAFRDDIYELDNSGFIVGQPMPVGEGGPRYVLKPIPRSPDAVDADEAFGFASLFRPRNPDKQDSTAPVRSSASARDSLVGSAKTVKKVETSKTATAKKKTFAKATGGVAMRNGNTDKQGVMGPIPSADSGTAKKKPSKGLLATKKKDTKTASKSKVTDKTKTAAAKKVKPGKPDAAAPSSAKKIKKTEEAQVAAKKPDAAAEAKATAAKKPAATAKKAPADCKPAADGKLPAGCKAPATAKKPAAKPAEKTASAAN
jgi:hypothetical protein